jgi:dTDP-4-amino-4,6-dideoxygalactose transaminase
LNDEGLYLAYPSGTKYSKRVAHWGISSFSEKVLNSSDYQKIKNIRRDNYEFLLNYFQNNDRAFLPFDVLPPGVCPLFFPLVIKKRDMFYKCLKKQRISGHDWWGKFHPDVPWVNFPEAVFLKKNILGLPIHQDLSFAHLHKIVEEFENICNHA